MKTQHEIEKMKDEIQKKIDIVGGKARSVNVVGSPEWENYDRQYAKLTAQYNILLEVLK